MEACAGHEAGSEAAAVHATKEIYTHDDKEVIHLVDTTNAFNEHGGYSWADQSNFVKCGLAVDSIKTYRAPVKLFVMGEGEIESTEGTTQGDTLAMAKYALAVTPLIHRLRSMKPDVKQVLHVCRSTPATDASATTES